jgi:hypothetical protein
MRHFLGGTVFNPISSETQRPGNSSGFSQLKDSGSNPFISFHTRHTNALETALCRCTDGAYNRYVFVVLDNLCFNGQGFIGFVSQSEPSAYLRVGTGDVFVAILVPPADVGDFIFPELLIAVLIVHGVSPFTEMQKGQPPAEKISNCPLCLFELMTAVLRALQSVMQVMQVFMAPFLLVRDFRLPSFLCLNVSI